eukprot:gb/GECG01004137.1/.p1 GENE.gb/GECG01004137.1/~~gb/GECG01004137.1/.p1  ORF type:complete len:909 (+),score=134.10 gb/GECG01004137.1/:1-2727(+)
MGKNKGKKKKGHGTPAGSRGKKKHTPPSHHAPHPGQSVSWKERLHDELEHECGITDQKNRSSLVHMVSELRKPIVNRRVQQVPVVDRKQVEIPEEQENWTTPPSNIHNSASVAADEDEHNGEGVQESSESEMSDYDVGVYAGIKPIRGLTTSGKKIRDPPKIYVPKELRMELEAAVDSYFDMRRRNRTSVFQRFGELDLGSETDEREGTTSSEVDSDDDDGGDLYSDTQFYAALHSDSDKEGSSSTDAYSSEHEDDSGSQSEGQGEETGYAVCTPEENRQKEPSSSLLNAEQSQETPVYGLHTPQRYPQEEEVVEDETPSLEIENNEETNANEEEMQYGHTEDELRPKAMYSDSEMAEAFDKLRSSSRFRQYETGRKSLPIYQMEDRIISAVDEYAVTVICGETGCGKTTQVPQIILDAFLKKGSAASCRIAVTQPRRIAAITVGERVAEERCSTVSHDRMWNLESLTSEQLAKAHAALPGVGYQVRFDRRIPDNAGVVFCTTGILLRWLLSDPDLEGFSHVLIDEVHERTLESDLLLIAIRDILVRRPSLRVVIMSATLDSQRFADYFAKYKACPVSCTTLQVPSAGHKVATLFLEDAIQLTSYDHLYTQSGGELCGVTNSSRRLGKSAKETPSRHSLCRNWDGEGLALLCDLAGLTSSDANTSTLSNLMKSFHGLNNSSTSSGNETTGSLLKHILTGAVTRRLPEFRQSELSNLICLLSDKSLATSSAGISREVRCAFTPYSADSIESLLEMELYKKPTVHFGFIVHILESIVNRESALLESVSRHASSQTLELQEGTSPEEAGVLIFLPGWSSMRKLQDMVTRHPLLGEKGRVETVLCHGNLHSKAQKAIFAPAPQGCRKVVIATNVAESSITIDRIRYVIDSGLFKQSDFVSLTRVRHSRWLQC